MTTRGAVVFVLGLEGVAPMACCQVHGSPAEAVVDTFPKAAEDKNADAVVDTFPTAAMDMHVDGVRRCAKCS